MYIYKQTNKGFTILLHDAVCSLLFK